MKIRQISDLKFAHVKPIDTLAETYIGNKPITVLLSHSYDDEPQGMG